ncbi:hypothetical protein GOV03_05195 [Candidatus Woesearchaeota archaeon]|nr:hypothetical protein [Candidatus Woesearchaeota archaeon]
MLDAYIIAELKRLREKKRREESAQIPLELPLFEEEPEEKEEEDNNPGEIIIDLKDGYRITKTYQ